MEGSSESKRFYGWIALGAASMTYFFMAGALMYSFGVFMPSICREFGWSRTSVSIGYTLVMLIMGFSGPFAGMFIGKYGAKRAIIVGNLLSITGLLLLAFHSQLWQFYIGYGAFIGVGLGLGGFLATSTVANNWFENKRSLALGLLTSSGGIGGLVMLPVIMSIIKNIGWRSAYMILAALVMIFGVIITALVIKNKPEDLGQTPDGAPSGKSKKKLASRFSRSVYITPVDFTVREVVRTRAIWLILLATTGFGLALSTIMAHQVAYLSDKGINPEIAATALGMVTGMSVIGRLGMGILGLRYEMRHLAIAAFTIMAIGMALILVVNSVPMIFVYATIVGIGFGATTVATVNLTPVYFGRTHYAKIMGFMTIFGVIGFAGAPIAGAMYDAMGSYTLPFSAAAGLLLIGIVPLFLATPPKHPSLLKAEQSAESTISLN